MAENISQLRRLIFRRYENDAWSTDFTIEPTELGQDSVLSFNIAPRMQSRATAMGTTETPIKGTLDAFAASVTFLPATWKTLGKALGNWSQATYTGATANAGNIIGGDPTNLCAGGEYYSVVCQGICDDGSTVDVEFTRCLPSVDDDIEIGSSDATEVTLNLHPIIYNASEHEGDGYPAYSYRMGDNSLTEKQRLNAATGEYVAVGGSE